MAGTLGGGALAGPGAGGCRVRRAGAQARRRLARQRRARGGGAAPSGGRGHRQHGRRQQRRRQRQTITDNRQTIRYRLPLGPGSAEGTGAGPAGAPATGARARRGRGRFRCGFARGKYRQLLLERSRLALGAGGDGVGTHQRLETLSAVLAGVFVDRHVVLLLAAVRRGQHAILRQRRVCKRIMRTRRSGRGRGIGQADARHRRSKWQDARGRIAAAPAPGPQFGVETTRRARCAACAEAKKPARFPGRALAELCLRLRFLVSGVIRKKARRKRINGRGGGIRTRDPLHPMQVIRHKNP